MACSLRLAPVLVVLGPLLVAGCGGGAAASPEPATAADPSSTEVTPPGDEAAPAPAGDEEASSADGEAPAEDLGEGDTRNTEVIAEVVKGNRKPVRECYEKALKQNGGLKGDLVVSFTLTPSGKVKQATLNEERSTLTDAGVVACVLEVIRGLTFPNSSKGLETSVNYPFNLNP